MKNAYQNDTIAEHIFKRVLLRSLVVFGVGTEHRKTKSMMSERSLAFARFVEIHPSRFGASIPNLPLHVQCGNREGTETQPPVVRVGSDSIEVLLEY